VKIEVVKPAENTSGILIRCYETIGGNYRCTLKSALSIIEAQRMNLLEEDAGSQQKS